MKGEQQDQNTKTKSNRSDTGVHLAETQTLQSAGSAVQVSPLSLGRGFRQGWRNL